MNLIDFTKNGGYRFKQFTLRKMQEAYFQLLKAFIAFCNVPETGNYIISGCIIVGPDITAGYLYIDGELCQFQQTAGTLATKIKKNVVIQSLGFKNGVNENVFRFVNAQTDLVDGAALSTFIRVSPVFDANYVHTDNNFTNAQSIKLGAIAAGAEVNVQANWTQSNPALDDFIKNKPEGQLLTYLKQGTYIHGSLIGQEQVVTISFADIGTENYKVIGSIYNIGILWDPNKGVTWSIRNYTSTSFQLHLFDQGNYSGQNVKFKWLLTPDITN